MGHHEATLPIIVLIAEDSDLDFHLLEHALSETKSHIKAYRATDGPMILKYLKGEGIYRDRLEHPFPHVIILDLKMPLMSGFEILEWLRDDPHYRTIPKIVLSTSTEPVDVQRAYELGANTYFRKPSRLPELQAICFHLAEYWKQAEIPPRWILAEISPNQGNEL
jgi:CheY-like chemotaxis protein